MINNSSHILDNLNVVNCTSYILYYINYMHCDVTTAGCRSSQVLRGPDRVYITRVLRPPAREWTRLRGASVLCPCVVFCAVLRFNFVSSVFYGAGGGRRPPRILTCERFRRLAHRKTSRESRSHQGRRAIPGGDAEIPWSGSAQVVSPLLFFLLHGQSCDFGTAAERKLQV